MLKKEVKNTYKEWAKLYDEDSKFNPAIIATENLLLPILKPLKKDKILDCGCGTGRDIIRIAKKVKSVIGIDSSIEMLKIAEKKIKDKKIKNAYLLKHELPKKLPFKDNSFDKIICILVMNHIEKYEKVLKEFKRVLKKGGTLIFDDFASDLSLPFNHIRPNKLYKKNQDRKEVYHWKSINLHIYSLNRIGFTIKDVKFVRVDEKMKDVLTKDTYKRNKGRSFSYIIKAVKD